MNKMGEARKIILFFPRTGAETTLLPASLLMVAGSLLQENFNVQIIDQRIDENWPEILRQELAKKEILAVGFSVLTGKQIDLALQVSKMVRRESKIPIIWGGVHASLLPEQTLRNDLIDIVVMGEGEKTMVELCGCLAENKDLSSVKGIGYKVGGKIVINPPQDFIGLDKMPLLPYQLVDVEKYIEKTSAAFGREGREIVFYTSRGCPHQCGFCYNQVFNRRRWRSQSAQKVVEHMDHLVRNYRITSFNIEDDEFFVDPQRASEICRLIKEKKLKLEIFTTHRINYLEKTSPEDLKKLYEVGFRTLVFGVESGSPRILKLIKKDITRQQVLWAAEKLKNTNINSKYCFMAGFPTETIQDLYQTTDLIQAMKQIDPHIKIPAWRVYTPYPGTELYELSIKHGFVPPERLEDWAGFEYHNVKMPWLDRRRERIIKNVMFLNRYLELPDVERSSLYLKFSRWYSKIVNYRWQKHWFGFVPEKYIINLFLRLKKWLD